MHQCSGTGAAGETVSASPPLVVGFCWLASRCGVSAGALQISAAEGVAVVDCDR